MGDNLWSTKPSIVFKQDVLTGKSAKKHDDGTPEAEANLNVEFPKPG